MSEGPRTAPRFQEFAESTLAAEERRVRAERARAYPAEHFGVWVTDEESAVMGVKLRESFAASRSVI
jgi:hypothetical protein